MEHAALCGDRTPIAVQQLGQCHGQCQQPGAHQIVEYPRNPWHPATVWCECGDRWSGGELLPRPFTPGWRQRAQHEFATAWLNAQPAGTRIVRDPDTLEPIATSRKSGTPDRIVPSDVVVVHDKCLEALLQPPKGSARTSP